MEQIEFTTVKYLVENNGFLMNEDIELLQLLITKYGWVEPLKYSEANNITRQTVYNQIKEGKIMSVKISDSVFVC